MRTYLRTRGRVRDYQFIGLAPEDTWWRSYARVTDLETPAILVESGGPAWRAYVSGIPSGRRDRVGRPIFIDLVLVGEAAGPAAAENAGDRELALAIIATVLDGDGDHGDSDSDHGDSDSDHGDSDSDSDHGDSDSDGTGSARPAPPRRPADRLDAVLTEEAVEEWLAEPTVSASQDAAAAIRAAFSDVPVPPAADGAGPHDDQTDGDQAGGDWVGGVGSARSRAAFLALAGRLLSGTAGRALMLSYVDDLPDVGDIPAFTGPGAPGDSGPGDGAPGDGELGILAGGHGPLSCADPRRFLR